MVRPLDRQVFEELLSQSVQAGISVIVRLLQKTQHEVLTGRFESTSHKTMTLLIQNSTHLTCPLEKGQSLKVTFIKHQTQYHFESRCLKVTTGQDEYTVEIDNPDRVMMTERRRSNRREFHKPSSITLWAMPSGQSWTCQAVLLNVSSEGLACKCSLDDTEPLQVGQVLEVRFLLEDQKYEYVLQACTVNITEGSDPQDRVIGLEFLELEDNLAPRLLLQQTLDADLPQAQERTTP